MAKPDNTGKQMRAYLEQLPIEQLEELLCKGVNLPDDKRDEAYIEAITEMIVRKEKEHPTGRLMDAEEGWRQFEQELNAPGYDGPIFPDTGDETEWPNVTDGKPAAAVRKKRWRGWRWATVAAIIVLFLVVVMPPALGYANVFSMVGQWSEEIFRFTPPDGTKEPDAIQPRNEIYQDLQDALDSNGVTTPLVPRWAPEGFKLEDIAVTGSPDFGRTDYDAVFQNGDEYVTIHLIQREVLKSRDYEKDGAPVERYTVGNVTHYIFENNGRIVTAWQNGYFECSIQGNITLDEMKEIISSIYKGESDTIENK